jgi:hypothetical protein
MLPLVLLVTNIAAMSAIRPPSLVGTGARWQRHQSEVGWFAIIMVFDRLN